MKQAWVIVGLLFSLLSFLFGREDGKREADKWYLAHPIVANVNPIMSPLDDVGSNYAVFTNWIVETPDVRPFIDVSNGASNVIARNISFLISNTNRCRIVPMPVKERK